MGVVLHYDMDTLTPLGLMKDLSGNMLDGVITNTTIVDGAYGKARRFNNPYNDVTDFIDVPYDASFDLSGDMAVFVRMTIRDSDPTQGFLEKSRTESTNKAYLLFAEASLFTFRIIDPSNRDVRSTTTIPDALNQQIILGGVKRGEDLEIWVNGTKEATTGGMRPTNTGVGTLRIGGLFSPVGLTGGDIEEVWIYDHAPSPSEILSLNRGTLILYSDGDGCEAKCFYDVNRWVERIEVTVVGHTFFISLKNRTSGDTISQTFSASGSLTPPSQTYRVAEGKRFLPDSELTLITNVHPALPEA